MCGLLDRATHGRGDEVQGPAAYCSERGKDAWFVGILTTSQCKDRFSLAIQILHIKTPLQHQPAYPSLKLRDNPYNTLHQMQSSSAESKSTSCFCPRWTAPSIGSRSCHLSLSCLWRSRPWRRRHPSCLSVQPSWSRRPCTLVCRSYTIKLAPRYLAIEYGQRETHQLFPAMLIPPSAAFRYSAAAFLRSFLHPVPWV
jgi:hypothetical protein